MQKSLLALAVFLQSFAFAQFELKEVKVTGDRQVELEFRGLGVAPTPMENIQEGVIELTFTGTQIAESLQGKLDLDAPHMLVRRISVYSPENNVVKAKIVVNGSTENLKSRFSFNKSENGLRAKLDYPKGDSTALALFKEEQEPVLDMKPIKANAGSKIPYMQFAMAIIVILAAGGGTLFAFKTLKKKGVIKGGSRKYLIEQMSYMSLGNKAGVSLLKIGHEFVLVGVTPNQVSFLHNLPRLQDQYEDETRLERGAFREAVEEESDRLHGRSETRRSTANA